MTSLVGGLRGKEAVKGVEVDLLGSSAGTYLLATDAAQRKGFARRVLV